MNVDNDSPATPNYNRFKGMIVTAVGCLTLVLIGFSVWKSVVEYRLTVQTAEVQTSGYARALREHAERTITEADNLLLEIVDHMGSGRAGGDVQAPMAAFLTQHPRRSPQVAAISLIDRTGLLTEYSAGPFVKHAQVADREYFRHHQKNPADQSPFLSRPFRSRIDGRWLITLSRPLQPHNGQFRGLVAIALDLDYFGKFYSSLRLGNKGKILLVRRDGAMLLSEPFREADLDIDFKKSVLFRRHLPNASSGTFNIQKKEALLEPGAHIVSYDAMPTFPIIAITNMETGEVLSLWQKNTLLQTALTIAVCGALWLLTLALLRQINRIEEAYRLHLAHQAEMEESSAAWQATFDAVEDAIWVMDLDRKVLRCNSSTRTIFGCDTEAATGSHCYQVAHGDAPLAGCPFRTMLETGKRASMQLMIGSRWYEVSVDPILDAGGGITGAVHIVSDISGIKRVEEQYRLLVDNLPVVTWQADERHRVHFISENVERLLGFPAESVYADNRLWLGRVNEEDRERVVSSFESLFAGTGVYDVEYRIRRDDGQWIWVHDFSYATIVRDSMPVAHGVISDITARKHAEYERDQLELQLRQAQKMEAIGHLAGGIAHDFNNLLTPILGYSEMIATRLTPGDPLIAKVAGISAAAHKAKDLTHQLLSFGRRQPIATSAIDLNEIIEAFYIVLRRTIRESITIDLKLDPQGAPVDADRSQMEQIILNMTVNAQDAVVGGKGAIFIETCRVYMEGENVRLHPGMVQGDYILLSFGDNGCGMSSEVLSHIFEPFFTTKPVGQGTGLGLATVYGIVKQHHGYISVSSREGYGTTFRIYFPAAAPVPQIAAEQPQAERGPSTRDRTVLVVEDNDMVREMVQEMLAGFEFQVLTAADALQALELARAYQGTIDLLVSDVVMPGISGIELYERLVLEIPELRVVYISGYPMNPSLRGYTLEEEVSYLQKPFTAEALLERIRMIL